MSTIGYDQVAAAVATREGWGEISTGVISRLAGEINSAGLPLSSTSTAYEAFRVVKSGPGTLFGFQGFNSSVSTQFILVFDAAGKPATGAVPVIILSVPTVTTFSASWVIPGRFFSRGIVLANSSTGPTLTLGAADCWFDAQYV